MPKIIIREKDNTINPAVASDNFAVVIPGFFRKKGEGVEYDDPSEVFKDNGICEFTTQKDFVTKIGKVAPVEFNVQSTVIPAHYGNQMAYELLGMGYTVLYVYLGTVEVDPDDPSHITGTASCITGINNLNSDGTIFEALRDKSNYNFRFITSGLISSYNSSTPLRTRYANQGMLKIVERVETMKDEDELENGRGDAIALLDVDDWYYTNGLANKSPKKVINAIRDEVLAHKIASKYGAFCVPSLCLTIPEDEAYCNNNKFPASFYYLACFMYSKANGNSEWYAAAGLNRGVSKYRVESTSVKLGEEAVYALEPRIPVTYNSDAGQSTTNVVFDISVNPVIKIRDNYYLWGNRTAERLTENDLLASHFLNIRQLCTTIKKDVYLACKRFTFDPNSDILWVNFCNAIRPTLERMKADQGIYDYEIVKVESKRAELRALIRIVPIEAVEDFDITVTLEDSLGTTIASVSE